MKLAMVQMKVKPTPEENLPIILKNIKDAKTAGADMVAFGEIIACAYHNDSMQKFAMPEDAEFLKKIAQSAKENAIYVVAGSVPERMDDKVYNTTYVFNAQGEQVAKHRKVHLFDINVAGGQRFMESEVLTAGDTFTAFDTPWGRIGVCICYDIRFPETLRLMALDGVVGVIVPAAFNMTTGPAHWEISFRTRALDNQIFMAGVAPARDMEASYTAWGHSISTDPWGGILVQMDEWEGSVITEWDMGVLDRVRQELPLLRHRRTDLYTVEQKNG